MSRLVLNILSNRLQCLSRFHDRFICSKKPSTNRTQFSGKTCMTWQHCKYLKIFEVILRRSKSFDLRSCLQRDTFLSRCSNSELVSLRNSRGTQRASDVAFRVPKIIHHNRHFSFWMGGQATLSLCLVTKDLQLSKDDEELLLSVLEGGVENLRQWTQARESLNIAWALHDSTCQVFPACSCHDCHKMS